MLPLSSEPGLFTGNSEFPYNKHNVRAVSCANKWSQDMSSPGYGCAGSLIPCVAVYRLITG